MFHTSQTLVYLHMPRYKENKLKTNNFVERNKKMLNGVIKLKWESGTIKSNLKTALAIIDKIMITESLIKRNIKFLFIIFHIRTK